LPLSKNNLKESNIMPTYKNLSQEPITNIMDKNGIYSTVYPYKEVETSKYYYRDATILEKISDSPYYNPIIQSDNLTLTDSSDSETILMDSDTKTLQIVNLSANLVYLYFQDVSNTPPVIIFPNSSSEFIIKHIRYEQIILMASAAITSNLLFIQQYKI
jgi:hypothetical protein